MYAGLSFGFFLKLRKEKKLGTLNRRALEQTLQAPDATNAAPCWATSRSARGRDRCRCEAHHLEMKSTNSGENRSAGSCGDGSSTTCLSCWNGVPQDS